MNKKENCPFCGKLTFYHQIKQLTLVYRSKPLSIAQPGMWCDKCGEGIIGGEDRKSTQKQLQTLRAKIDGLLPPDEIKKIREKLHIKQKDACELFGGGVNAFSRYERGETPIPKPLSQLLFLLNKHPNLLQEIRL